MNQNFTYKVILITILSTLLVNPIYSQDSNIEIGIEGGPSLTSLRGESQLTRLSGPVLHLFMELLFKKISVNYFL